MSGRGEILLFLQKPFLAHFSITFLSAIQVLVWYKNLSYFFAENHRLKASLPSPIHLRLIEGSPEIPGLKCRLTLTPICVPIYLPTVQRCMYNVYTFV